MNKNSTKIKIIAHKIRCKKQLSLSHAKNLSLLHSPLKDDNQDRCQY